MAEEKKYNYLDDDDDDEHILDPNNDRRTVISDSQNKYDGIIRCIGSIESQCIPDSTINQPEKTHGTGTVIHIDDHNNVYILTAAHNILHIERRCQICNIKTIKIICNKCNGKTSKTGGLIKPTHVYFSRRGDGINKKYKLGETIQRYCIADYKFPNEYEAFPTGRSGYDICIAIFKCPADDKHTINLYNKHCSNISLITDETFGGNKCPLYLYGYPYEKRQIKEDYKTYYYLFGMGTSNFNVSNNFSIGKNVYTHKSYIVNKGIDTTGGQSGSCIYSYYHNDKKRYKVYGIHSGGSQKYKANYGTFFDTNTIKWIQKVLPSNKLQNKHSNNVVGVWKWDDNGKWSDCDPSVSKQIDDGIRSQYKNPNKQLFQIQLNKGAWFSQPKNMGIYFCNIELNHSRTKIKTVMQQNKNTGFKRKMTRTPLFELHSHNTKNTYTKGIWAWYNGYEHKWKDFDMTVSKEIDDNIRYIWLNKNYQKFDFSMTKGSWFCQKKNIGVYVCDVWLNDSRSEIEKVMQKNKQTGYEREMKRTPPFQL
eukprot:426820_1